MIHIVTSKNQPDLHIELNEAWVLNSESGEHISHSGEGPKVECRETYPNGHVRATWGAFVKDGIYLLSGQQIFYYSNGRKQWATTFAAGHRTGVETLWNEDGQKLWEKSYGDDSTWTWRLFDAGGKVRAESKWQGKDLITP